MVIILQRWPRLHFTLAFASAGKQDPDSSLRSSSGFRRPVLSLSKDGTPQLISNLPVTIKTKPPDTSSGVSFL